MKGENNVGAPVLVTERLVLKPMSTEYLVSTHEYASDSENCKYMLFLPNETIDETLEYLKDAEKEAEKDYPSYYEMAIFYNGVHVGAVSLYISDERDSAEMGWTLNKRYHGMGIATEAARALLQFAAEKLGIRRFVAHCDSENMASRRVMEKLGMTLEGEYSGRRNKLSTKESNESMFILKLAPD